MENHTEASIIKKLRAYFQNGYSYRIENAFIFSDDWESDFFCINREGWSFDFEVKISRSDFKADFKKKKHEIFTKGSYTTTHNGNSKEIVKKFIPNRFYYAVPEGLVTKDEVPEYAGLISVSRYASIIKRAPFIHREKFDFRKKLCDKFYTRWIEEIRKSRLLEYDNKELLEKIENIKAKYPNEFNTRYF